MNSGSWMIRHIFWLFCPLRTLDPVDFSVPHTTMIYVTLTLKENFQTNWSNGATWNIGLLCDFKWVEHKKQENKQIDIACINKPRWTRIKIVSFLKLYKEVESGVLNKQPR